MTISELKPNSLEKTLLDPFGKLPKHLMTKEQTDIMISLTLIPPKNIDGVYEEVKKKSWVLSAIESRIKNTFTIIIEKKVQLFILMFLNGNVGKCMVYILYLQYWAKSHNKRNISWEDFTMKAFPTGFPDEKMFEELWDKQKVEGSNMIDLFKAHKSIHFDV